MKTYNNEKAIISLTSWRSRIKTVGITIYNLYKTCKNFHIVLVLSSDEFPQKEKELPEDLKIMLNNNIFEIIWVKKNYKAFKKIVFTLDKYRNVPVISADDDCIYKINYAEILYKEWLKEKNCVISFTGRRCDNTIHTGGCYTIFPPYCFKEYGIKFLDDFIISLNEDDKYYSALKSILKINSKIISGYHQKSVITFVNEIQPLHNIYSKKSLDDSYKKMKCHIYEKL